MHIQHHILADKLALFTLAGIAPEGAKGWDYAIPQQWCDDLSRMGIDSPAHWFAADCTGPSAFPQLHHIGEAYVRIVNHRSKANQEIFMELFNKNGDSGDSKESIATERAFYDHLLDDKHARDEADAGFVDINMLLRSFVTGVNFGKTLQDRFILMSSISPKRPGEKHYRIVIRDKNHASSGTKYVIHLWTMEDDGFHNGYYTDSAVDALRYYMERCEKNDVSPLPLVNENH